MLTSSVLGACFSTFRIRAISDGAYRFCLMWDQTWACQWHVERGSMAGFLGLGFLVMGVGSFWVAGWLPESFRALALML